MIRENYKSVLYAALLLCSCELIFGGGQKTRKETHHHANFPTCVLDTIAALKYPPKELLKNILCLTIQTQSDCQRTVFAKNDN